MKGHPESALPATWPSSSTSGTPRRQAKAPLAHVCGAKRQAQVECARPISDLNGGTYLEPNKTTVAQFLYRWLDDIKAKVTPKTHVSGMPAASSASPQSPRLWGERTASASGDRDGRLLLLPRAC